MQTLNSGVAGYRENTRAFYFSNDPTLPSRSKNLKSKVTGITKFFQRILHSDVGKSQTHVFCTCVLQNALSEHSYRSGSAARNLLRTVTEEKANAAPEVTSQQRVNNT